MHTDSIVRQAAIENWRAQVPFKGKYGINDFKRRANADAWAIDAGRSFLDHDIARVALE